MPRFFVEDDDILHTPCFFHVGAHDYIRITLQHAHEPFGRREGEAVVFVFLAFEIALVSKTGLREFFEQGRLVDVFGDVATTAREEAGDGAALRAEDEHAAFFGQIDEAIEGREPLFLGEVSEQRAHPDQIKLFAEIDLSKIGLRIDGNRIEFLGAEIDAVALKITAGDGRVIVVGAKPAHHPPVAAREIENLGVVRLVAELSGELHELQRASTDVEILIFQTFDEHAVAGRNGPRGLNVTEIEKVGHVNSPIGLKCLFGASAYSNRTGRSVFLIGAGPNTAMEVVSVVASMGR